MQRFRINKPRSDYKRLGENICITGSESMAPCPQCQLSGARCVVRKGNKRCGPCTKKNVVCDGNFSQTVFDNLENKKAELRRLSKEGRRLMRVFANQLLSQQKKQEDIERRLDEISRRQEAMLDRESRALGEMDDLAPAPGDPEQEVMGFEDDFFLMDDPSLLSWGLGPEGTTPGGPSSSSAGPAGRGAFPVPRCFLTRHILTT